MRPQGVVLLAVAALGLAAAVSAQPDPEGLRSAKALFFDRKYAEARQAWQAVLARSRGAEADTAAYWIARCSQNLGEDERALKEYGDFLYRRPTDRALVEEARTSRIGLAARLYKTGKRQYLPIVREALTDGSKTVRYYAALQLATLGPQVGQPAVPVLRGIVEEEKDEDLVERAKLALLRVDPQALSRLARPPGPGPAPDKVRWLKIRIFDSGQATPKVSVNLPVALAEMVFKSLPEDAMRELRRKGYDAENFWERLHKLGPTEIIKIEGDHGERIHIWIE